MEFPEQSEALGGNADQKQPEEQPAAVAAETGKPEEQVEITAETVAADDMAPALPADEPAEAESARKAPATKEEVLELLAKIAGSETDVDADEAARLKRDYYNIVNASEHDAFKKFTDEGGNPDEFVAPADETEARLKELLTVIKEKKAAQREALAAQQLRNAERKQEIISEIEKMAADTDNVNRHYQQVKDLQAEFKTIGEVPQEQATALWKGFTSAVELFYDQWKVNKELRDYDFRKNLSEKQLLLDEAEKLADEPDVITAFKRLQELHQKWRETGPVAKDVREEIWNKFKDASAVVNKKYQAFFEERKARERANEEAKTALCERIEAIDFSQAKSFNDWNALTKQIIEAQEEWKNHGFASRKMNNALFARFRETCDKFFAAKAEYFKTVKDSLADNLARKTALCEQAEALKDSTEWRKTTDNILELKAEWKKIGAVPKKHSDAVWRRFMDACDYFFDQKKKQTSAVRKTENANLRAKQQIVARLTELNQPDCKVDRAEAIEEIHKLREQWQGTGHVPFKEKDKLHDTYRTVVGELFEKYDIRENRARMAEFESAVNQSNDSGRLSRDRERMMRALETRRNELKTYQNNLGFFNSKSKQGEQMLKEMERKMQHIKDDIADLEKKITIIDNKI